jgi:hypothetical protein
MKKEKIMPREKAATDSIRVVLRIPAAMMGKIEGIGSALGLPPQKAVMHCLTIGVQACSNTVNNDRSANVLQEFMEIVKAADESQAAEPDRKPKARRVRARA